MKIEYSEAGSISLKKMVILRNYGSTFIGEGKKPIASKDLTKSKQKGGKTGPKPGKLRQKQQVY